MLLCTQVRGYDIELKRTSYRRKPRQFLQHGRAHMHNPLCCDTCMHTNLQALHKALVRSNELGKGACLRPGH